jgi:hypothetical protein
MMRLKWIGTGCFAAVLSLVATAGWSAPQEQSNQPYPSAEFSTYQTARNEQHPPKKLALLDAFLAEHPDSVLVTAAFREYAGTYLIVGNSRKSIEYIDKFLAQLDKIDPGMLPEGLFGRAQRLDGLYMRARGYLEGGCSDSAFQTPDAYRQARDAATEGLRLLGDWNERPRNMKDYEFAFLKNQAGVRFNAAARIAESGLEGADPVNLCKAPGTNFDHIVNDIKAEERESPQVR